MSKKLLDLKWLGVAFLAGFILLSHVAMSQQVITGKVIADDGTVLPGVNIIIEGTSSGTATDADGMFSISVPKPDAVLVLSFIGYKTQRITAGAQSKIDVIMVSDFGTLDEVIVVGYGSEKKRDIAGAISSVSSKGIEERKPLNVFDALQGQAAGVQITAESSRPGANSTVLIRGIGTMQGGANPLYVIDGALAESPAGINPNDIDKIEILKDGASTAIYGVQGANGVIIITTKRGVSDKPRFDVSYLRTYSTMANKIPQSNADQRREFNKITSATGTVAANADSLNPSVNADIDMLSMLTRTAVRDQVDVSVGGGSKALTYYASMGYLGDQGIILNSYAKTIRNRLNVDYSSGRFSAGNRLMFSYTNENRIDESRTLIQAIQRPPTFRVYLPDGTLAPVLGGRRNPVAEALLTRNRYDTYDASIYNFLSYKIADYLKFTSDFQFRLTNERNNTMEPLLVSSSGVNSLGDKFTQKLYWINQNYFSFEKTFGTDHRVSAVLGMSEDKRNSFEANIEGTNLVSEAVRSTNTLQTITLSKTRTIESVATTSSFFGRVGYIYRDRYIFNASLRRDGSSRFGANNRWGSFPGVSAAWRFTDETFMNWATSVVDDGKLRISYGETGNNRIPDFASVQQYEFGSNFYNGISGASPSSTLGNNTLSWEVNKQFNIGTDLTLFNGRATVVFDYYKKITQKLLYSTPLPSESGYTDEQVNIGSIQNEGIELAISGYPVERGPIRWNTSFNITINNNTVKQLYGGTSFIYQNKWSVSEGGRLGNFYGWNYQGVYPYDESNAYSSNWEQLTLLLNEGGGLLLDAGGKPQYTLNGEAYTGTPNKLKSGTYQYAGGDVIWSDVNHDGQIDDNDRIVLGNAQPKFYLGWNNIISYKNLSLSFNIYTSWGSKIYDKARRDTYVMSPTNITPQPYFIDHAWRNPGDVTDIWRARNVPQNLREINSYFIENGSYIRLRNVKLTYSFDAALAAKLHVKGLSAYVYGSNLLTWTNYLWFDPEISVSNPLAMGQDGGAYPKKRELGMGLNIGF